jgi:hypothetical protein
MTSRCPSGHTSTADDYCDVCGVPIEAGSGQGASGPAPAPGGTSVAAPGSASTPDGQQCPNCETHNVADALFCEACGYDFTTGTMPRSAVPLTPPEGAAQSAAPVPTQGLAPPDVAPPESGAAAPAATSAGGATALGPQTGPPAGSPAPADQALSWVAEVWIDPAWYEVQDSPDTMPSAGLPAIVPLRGRSVLVGRKSRSRNINPEIDCEPDTGASRRQAQLTTDGTRWWVEDLESSNGTFVAGASEPLPEDPIPVGPKHELRPDDRIYVGAWTRIVIRSATDEEKTSLG